MSVSETIWDMLQVNPAVQSTRLADFKSKYINAIQIVHVKHFDLVVSTLAWGLGVLGMSPARSRSICK